MDCVLFLLSSSLFLKAHNHGGDILLLLTKLMKGRYILPPLGDAQTLTPVGQMTIVPSWLTLLSWSLVSRTVQCTQFLAEIRKEGGWGRWELKKRLIQF